MEDTSKRKKIQKFIIWVSALILVGLASYKIRRFIPPSLPVKIVMSEGTEKMYGSDVARAIQYLNSSFNKDIVSLSKDGTGIWIGLSEESTFYEKFYFNERVLVFASIEERRILIFKNINNYSQPKYLFLAHEILHIILARDHVDAEHNSILNEGSVVLKKFSFRSHYFWDISQRLPEYDRQLILKKHDYFFE